MEMRDKIAEARICDERRPTPFSNESEDRGGGRRHEWKPASVALEHSGAEPKQTTREDKSVEVLIDKPEETDVAEDPARRAAPDTQQN